MYTIQNNHIFNFELALNEVYAYPQNCFATLTVLIVSLNNLSLIGTVKLIIVEIEKLH